MKKENIPRLRERLKEKGRTVKRVSARLFRPAASFCGAHLFSLQLLCVWLYRLLLDVLYLTMVVPIYGYQGFRADLQLPLYGASLLAALAFSPFVVRLQEEHTPSAYLVTFLNYIYFIPLTSYCGCKGVSLSFFLIAHAYWAMLLLFQFQLPVLRLKPLPARHARQAYLLLTVLSAAFVMFISGRYTGFRFTLNFLDVYGIREEAAGYSMPGIFSYALSMMGIVLAILLLYWMSRKKFLATAALVIVYLFLFSIAAHKALFFFLLLLLAGYYLYRPWMLRWIGGLLALFSGAALAEQKITGTFYLMNLFFRRSMFLVNELSEQYMDFFQKNPIALFRDSILGKLPLISSLYSTDIPKVIGEFRGNIGENANNGLLGDMFANLPALLGFFMLPLVLIVCFRLLDAAAHDLPEKLVISACVFFATSFSNGSWSTVLLSNGYLAACLLFYFFPKKEEKLIS